MKKIGFIGFGNMGSALGLSLRKDYRVYYYDIEKKPYEDVTFATIETILMKCEYVILAIKPHQYKNILSSFDFSNNCVISIAAGITSEFMEKFVDKYVLTMPNTPALINNGYTAIVKNKCFDSEVEKIFTLVGEVYYISEDELSSAICLTGSSPAYFFNFIDKLSSSFNKKDRNDIELMLAKVMKSAANMIIEKNESAKTLTDNVCSPNGTTIQAVNHFNNSNLEEICKNAIEACYNRAEEMKK